MMMHRGHCFCRSVEFEVEGPEIYACYCHCESCRRASGAAFVPWATFTKSGFKVLAGELAVHQSSLGVTRGHCAECGTCLTYEHAKRAGQVDITLTSLEDPSAIAPRSHIWVEDKLSGIIIGDTLPQFNRTAG